MRKIAIGLLAGAGALLTGSANASDVYTSTEYTNSDLIQQVRMVCDDNGRCYRTRGDSRVIVRDLYAYAPRERRDTRKDAAEWLIGGARRGLASNNRRGSPPRPSTRSCR